MEQEKKAGKPAWPVWKKVIITLLLVCGIGLIMYPTVNSAIQHYNNQQRISEYKKTILEKGDLPNAKKLLCIYNDLLEQRSGTRDISRIYNQLFDKDSDGLIGYVDIPRIAVSLPIYSYNHPEKHTEGAMHLRNTTLPIDAETNNFTIMAHAGMGEFIAFTRLNELEIGDRYKVIIFDNIYEYVVDEVRTVMPEEVESVVSEDHGNSTYLVTCTPIFVNTRRLIVRGSLLD